MTLIKEIVMRKGEMISGWDFETDEPFSIEDEHERYLREVAVRVDCPKSPFGRPPCLGCKECKAPSASK